MICGARSVCVCLQRMSEDVAYGGRLRRHRGKEKQYGHTGGTPGADVSFEVFPELVYMLIVLSNQGERSRDIAQAIQGWCRRAKLIASRPDLLTKVTRSAG